uniref:Microtubule-associated protein futsch n=1 Tax=Elaeophora elaphi TaxID=1147741 RepID=A0A0R3RPK0_9BILA
LCTFSVENWKENVPDIDNNKAPNAHFLRRVKNRSNSTRGNNNSTSKKLTEIKEKKQKLEGNKMTVCAETNKITSPTNKKIFDAKNSKNLKNSGSTSNDNDSAVRNTHRMKAMNRLKQSHLSSNEQPNKSYKKSSSGSSKNRYSTRRVASTAATLPLPTAFMQHLDTVKVNVSMLELKKVLISKI